MSSTLVPVKFGDQNVWVEVTDHSIVPPPKAELTEKTAAGSRLAMGIDSEDLVKTLQAVLGPVHSAMKSFKPDELNVELSIGFELSAGFFVASSTGSAALKIAATWDLSSKPD